MLSTKQQYKKIIISSHQIQINTFNDKLVSQFHTQQPLNIISITMQGNSYSKQFCRQLCQYFKKTSNLQNLNINDIFVSRSKEQIPQSIKFLSLGLIKTKLKKLDISNNAVNAYGAQALVTYLSSANNLRVLLMNNCGLGPLGVNEIAQGLKGTSELRVLALGRNRMQNAGIISIAKIIKYIPFLEDLFVYQNTLKKQGLCQLFKQLYLNCKNLNSLDLCDSFIRQQATKQISTIIKECLNLKNLNLSDCLVESQNQQIIKAFQNSKNLSFQRLGLNFIDLNSQLALRLLKLIQNYPLKRLDIIGNELPNKVQKKYREYFGQQSTVLSNFDDDDEQQIIRLFEEIKV